MWFNAFCQRACTQGYTGGFPLTTGLGKTLEKLHYLSACPICPHEIFMLSYMHGSSQTDGVVYMEFPSVLSCILILLYIGLYMLFYLVPIMHIWITGRILDCPVYLPNAPCSHSDFYFHSDLWCLKSCQNQYGTEETE